MYRTSLKPLVLALSLLWVSPNIWAANTDSPTNETTNNTNDSLSTVKLQQIEVVGSKIPRDEIGYTRVFTRDISNLYKGKDEIETYRGNSVSDLFNGMVGVYSGDSRNSGALDPNIRGVQGQGRIPVTIDGTEQSITVWRGYAGSNNRNYVDPNIISSIYIEKGPSLDPTVKSGIGGSVAMKTLEVDDIVKPGKKYGVEVKAEIGNNAIKPLPNPYEQTVDYRTLSDPYSVTGGMWRMYFGDDGRQPQRFGGETRWNADKAFRLAAGVKEEKYDAMIAYAYRNKGNYFSGKNGADGYGVLSQECIERVKTAGNDSAVLSCLNLDRGNPHVSYLARLYFPSGEVTNTSLNTKSWLAKANFHPTPDQTISLGSRITNTTFGEIMPSRIGVSQGTFSTVLQWPKSWVKQKAFNLDYKFNPKDNKWLNLNASLWTTRTHSKTNSAGGSPGDVFFFDSTAGGLDAEEKYQEFLKSMEPYGGKSTLADMAGLNSNDPDFDKKFRCSDAVRRMGLPIAPQTGCLENVDGRFNTLDGAAYYARNNRIGFNLSNKMQLTDKLELTLMGDIQKETLRATNNLVGFMENPFRTFSDGKTVSENNYSDGISYNTQLDNIGLPRNGKRHEYSLGFNFKYQPTSWLTLNAGARYSSYGIKDNYIEKYLNSERNKDVQEFRISNGFGYNRYLTATKEEVDTITRLDEQFHACFNMQDETQAQICKDSFSQQKEQFLKEREAKGEYVNVGGYHRWEKLISWEKDEYGKFQLSGDPFNLDAKQRAETILNGKGNEVLKTEINKDYSALKLISRQTLLERAKQQSGSGWAPQFSFAARIGENGRLYGRYVEHLRWPSIFEGTVGFGTSAYGYGGRYQPDFSRLYHKFRPEHAKNWEIGYVHDLTGLLPKARYADMRINYYHNVTKNVMDRDATYTIYQFDKQIKTGIEWQARADFGRVFADFGVVRTLKTQVCDAAYARAYYDYNYGSAKPDAPECWNGGMQANGYLAYAVQPRWSITANLGSRWLNEKLELGTRLTYHSRVKDTYGETKHSYIPSANDLYIDSYQPVFLVDGYIRYRFGKNISAELAANNITNQYYQDPMTSSMMPAPGRTIRLGIKGSF